MKRGVFGAELPGVALVDRDREMGVSGPFPGKPDKIPRSVDPGDTGESGASEFESMPSLAAAEIENVVVGLQKGDLHDHFDLASRVFGIFNYIAVGLEIQRIEKGPPPIGR